MEYRRLGQAGLKVSQLSLGSWVTFSNQVDQKKAIDCMAAAFEGGVNFFDNAEVYAQGQSEVIMGEALKKLAWPRMKYIVSTKFFWGISDGPNERNTLNRKYLLNGIQGSLKRLQMEFVDLVYCHRPDPNTPIEETVWAMHNIIERGYALYWGTSEWSAKEIQEAYRIAEKHSLHKPIVEQPQYNLFHRVRVEHEYLPIYEQHGMGLTTWSPLASGLLTGKYLKEIPQGSRLSLQNLSWLKEEAMQSEKQKQVERFVHLAKEIGVPPACLAIAWCAKNPHVSSVITGATSVEQIHQNLKSLEVLPKLTTDVLKTLNEIFKH